MKSAFLLFLALIFSTTLQKCILGQTISAGVTTAFPNPTTRQAKLINLQDVITEARGRFPLPLISDADSFLSGTPVSIAYPVLGSMDHPIASPEMYHVRWIPTAGGEKAPTSSAGLYSGKSGIIGFNAWDIWCWPDRFGRPGYSYYWQAVIVVKHEHEHCDHEPDPLPTKPSNEPSADSVELCAKEICKKIEELNIRKNDLGRWIHLVASGAVEKMRIRVNVQRAIDSVEKEKKTEKGTDPSMIGKTCKKIENSKKHIDKILMISQSASLNEYMNAMKEKLAEKEAEKDQIMAEWNTRKQLWENLQ